MLNPTIVICLLFVVTATSGFDFLPPMQEWFDRAMNNSINEVKSYHETAKTQVEAAMSVIRFERRYQPKYWNKDLQPQKNRKLVKLPSGECYEFLWNSLATNKTEAIKCSSEHVESATRRRDRLGRVLNMTLGRLKAQANAALNCEAWHNYLVPNNAVGAQCVLRIGQKLTAIVEEAKPKFLVIIKNAEKLVNTWILEAGRCIAHRDDISSLMNWYNVCKYSIRRPNNRSGKKPSIV